MTLALLGLLAAVNPAAASRAIGSDRRTNRPKPITTGAIVAWVALVGVAAAGDPLLDALDISVGTYELGAGVVAAVAGLRWLAVGTPAAVAEPDDDRWLAGFVAFPTLITPGAVVLAVSIAVEDGLGLVAVASAVAVAAGAAGVAFRRSLDRAVTAGLTRLFGAVLTVVGIIVAVDGIRTL